MKSSRRKFFSCQTSPKSSNPCSLVRIAPKNLGKDQKKPSSGSSPKDEGKKLLKKLNSRRSAAINDDVSAEMAATVVKKFILPMFNLEQKRKLDDERKKKHNRKFSEDQGTVYSELKLSERLSKELETTKLQISTIQKSMFEATQDKEMFSSDYKTLKMQLFDAQTNLSLYITENQRLNKEIIETKFSIGLITTQLGNYKSLYEESTKEIQRISGLLHEEKVTNDIRFYIYFL
jgi:hypothetical protein